MLNITANTKRRQKARQTSFSLTVNTVLAVRRTFIFSICLVYIVKINCRLGKGPSPTGSCVTHKWAAFSRTRSLTAGTQLTVPATVGVAPRPPLRFACFQPDTGVRIGVVTNAAVRRFIYFILFFGRCQHSVLAPRSSGKFTRRVRVMKTNGKPKTDTDPLLSASCVVLCLFFWGFFRPT